MALDPDIEAKYTQNRKVMVASAILLVILILVIIFFHIFYRFYRRHRLRQLSHHLPTTTNSSLTTNEASLDPSVLKTLPIFTYTSVTNAPLNECAVCLTDFADGDEGRLLPNCKHAFHRQCIDTWFGSNSTCPLCRALVQPVMDSIETELDSSSGSEAGEGCSSSFLEPVWCPRKPLGIIVEVPQDERGSDLVPGDQGLKWSLKRFCSV